MKNHFIVTLLIVLMSGTIATAQTRKPTTTTKKPTTTVKSTVPKTTTTTKKTTTTTTTTTPVTPPPVVEEKKTTTTTTTTTTPTETKSATTSPSTTTTTTTQSTGPSKGKKTNEPKVKEPKPERVREPKPERVREPKPERVRTPRSTSSSGSGGVKFGLRAEASQLFILDNKIGGDVAISPGFNAGLIVNLPINEKIAIQPEVLYSMKVLQSVEVANSFSKNTFNSILVPVMLNINLGQGSTKFMVNVGGFADYLLSQTNEITVSGVKTSSSLDLTNFDKFDYGIAGGLGAKINSKFIIEARTFYSLRDNVQKSMLVTLGIGYMF